MMLPALAPGSKVGIVAAEIERKALEIAPRSLLAEPYFRERLHAHCIERAIRRASDPVQ